MTPEQEGPKKFSRSKKIRNRRDKEENRENIPLFVKTIEVNANKERLEKIGRLLSPNNHKLLVMNHMERAIYRAELKIEQNWLQLKCGLINQEQQEQLLSEYMDKLFRTMPDVHKVLVGDEIRPSIAREIHDKVFPPPIPGYRARR